MSVVIPTVSTKAVDHWVIAEVMIIVGFPEFTQCYVVGSVGELTGRFRWELQRWLIMVAVMKGGRCRWIARWDFLVLAFPRGYFKFLSFYKFSLVDIIIIDWLDLQKLFNFQLKVIKLAWKILLWHSFVTY